MTAYREARAEDLPAICVLGEGVHAIHHEAWPHIFAAPGDPLRHAQHWRKTIGVEDGTTYVAECDEGLVGFVTVNIVDERSSLLQPNAYGRVGSLSVAPTHRGRGIGRELMDLAERWIRGRGVQDVRLNVWAFNEAALRLYEELGYEGRTRQLGKRLLP